MTTRTQISGLKGFEATVAAGEVLHVWQKPAGGATSRVWIVGHGPDVVLSGPPTDDFQMQVHTVAATGQIRLEWDEAETAVSICYAFDPSVAFDRDIRVLWASPAATVGADRFRLHFTPPFGWMNDPNGLIEIGGRAHLFYQHYPHALRWNNMHWGHAVSEDLVHWTHLPVFLHPPAGLLADNALKGGAFSGSAIAGPNGSLRVFHTDRQDGRQPEQEWQMTAISPDGISVAPSTPVIKSRPPLPGFGPDLRDPFVFKGPDGAWKMLLGGADANAALVLMYETDHPEATEGWRFAGVLHREPLERAVPAECPCLIALDGEGDGLFALVFGLVGHQSPVLGRLNPNFALVGRFDGKTFTEIARRELDFIGDCYAFQSFAWAGRPVGIAWAANWAYVGRSHDFPSCMTFPRRLVWQDKALLMPQVETVQALRTGTLVADLAQGVALGDGLVELALDFTCPGAFRLSLDHPDNPLLLTFEDGALELTGTWARPLARSVRHLVQTSAPRHLTLYVDVGLVEVAVDGGRLNGTKRIDTDLPFTRLTLETGPDTKASAALWRLRPAKSADR